MIAWQNNMKRGLSRIKSDDADKLVFEFVFDQRLSASSAKSALKIGCAA